LTWWALPLNSLILLAVLFGQLLSSLNRVQRTYQTMVTYESAFWALRATIRQTEQAQEMTPGGIKPELHREISLRRVDFSYGAKPVLRNVSLVVPIGQVTAIVGPSGAGKTSIADLIIGLVRPQSGDVWLDDLPLSEIDLQLWRHQVGYVPQ